MNREQILKEMDLAIRQDRERFFKTADTLHLQPKYQSYLNELEFIKQQWRDITSLTDYPNITHPILLPEWFPEINFASNFKKDDYIGSLEETQEATADLENSCSQNGG